MYTVYHKATLQIHTLTALVSYEIISKLFTEKKQNNKHLEE